MACVDGDGDEKRMAGVDRDGDERCRGGRQGRCRALCGCACAAGQHLLRQETG